ncbi:MAG: hypothetical protein ACI8V2_005305 [Candidatus Latescibacterota bacterium]|jgi:hypothetical protein
MDELIDQNEFYNLKRGGRFLVADPPSGTEYL